MYSVNFENLKDRLIDLLFEQCKQNILIDKIEEHGISLDPLRVDNWKIVAAILGINVDAPGENTVANIHNTKTTPWARPSSLPGILGYDLLSDDFFEVVLTIAGTDTNNDERTKRVMINEGAAKERIREHLCFLINQAEMRDEPVSVLFTQKPIV